MSMPIQKDWPECEVCGVDREPGYPCYDCMDKGWLASCEMCGFTVGKSLVYDNSGTPHCSSCLRGDEHED